MVPGEDRDLITKAELRRRMAAERDALDPAAALECSARIRDLILGMPEIRDAGSIFIYVSCGSEVDTHGLIRALLTAGRTVAVPRSAGDGLMEAHRIRDFGELVPGRFGILAPEGSEASAGTPEVSICPGLAFSPQGGRLGRGKAYYDRFLAAHPGTFAIGLCFGFQVVDALPVSPEDQPMRAIVTEDRILQPYLG